MLIRSKLFVPGSRPELFEKAAASAADAVSFDLEDAVAPDRKAAARTSVASFLRAGAFSKIAIVRVNAPDTEWFHADLESVIGPGVDVINLPKMESASGVRSAVESIARAEQACGLDRKITVLANIETPKGLRLAHEIATADPRVMGLQIGFADLFLPLGIDRGNPNAAQFVRMAVRLAAGEAGIPAWDAAFPDIRNPELCRAEAEASRQLGYAGKSCIHPSQIAIANEVFAPRPDEVEHAKNVLASARDAAERGIQAFVVDGQLIDAPMIGHARAVAAAAGRFEMTATALTREPDAL
jgi:citrate lyase subunit beta/citryl-CoA lyase